MDLELKRAVQARSESLEGRARVCARRAAAIAIQEYYRRQGSPTARRSAIDWIELLRNDSASAAFLRQTLDLFLVRVRPDFQLPVDADLLAEIRGLVNHLGLDDV